MLLKNSRHLNFLGRAACYFLPHGPETWYLILRQGLFPSECFSNEFSAPRHCGFKASTAVVIKWEALRGALQIEIALNCVAPCHICLVHPFLTHYSSSNGLNWWGLMPYNTIITCVWWLLSTAAELSVIFLFNLQIHCCPGSLIKRLMKGSV